MLCAIVKLDDQTIVIILLKMKDIFDIFVFTFYSTRDALVANYIIPFDIFCEQLTHEEDKCLYIGVFDISSK
jgi:hypothetical protein